MSTSDSTMCPVEKVYGVVSGAKLAPSSAAPPPAAAAPPPAAAASVSTPGTPHGNPNSSISAKLLTATDSWEILSAKAHGIIMQYICTRTRRIPACLPGGF
ncbi:hypothetical protein PLICRDRAFT_180717 [Plicaturopsis crispa FD-325 SS-3]|uniref:Uncharacterized protein n=1 Tax=Plicaturopsis crispa FD-325 SS-3 TaxID=944288 RepID=A0A0C9T1P5_PLICR|nr:hypothetical protein PLICRDRAFT_180717 [Plicaturopsis crispa FD-325 SS-3]